MAYAMLEGPISDYLPGADTIYLVRVSSFDQKTVNFSVTETLRGNPVKSLSLIPFIIDLSPNAEFLILSSNATRNGQRGNGIGSLMKGNLGWQDAPVVREGTETYVYCPAWKDGHLVCDKEIKGLGYLTLEHIKRLLK
jgi:hypothetical protein